jgi:preprotein translocase subunit SecA
VLRFVVLSTIDEKWKDHLYDLDHLKASIGFRGWGQKDPLVEYKKEAFDMFEDLMKDLYASVSRFTFRAQLAPAMETPPMGFFGFPEGTEEELMEDAGMSPPPPPAPEPAPAPPPRRAPLLGVNPYAQLAPSPRSCAPTARSRAPRAPLPPSARWGGTIRVRAGAGRSTRTAMGAVGEGQGLGIRD